MSIVLFSEKTTVTGSSKRIVIHCQITLGEYASIQKYTVRHDYRTPGAALP